MKDYISSFIRLKNINMKIASSLKSLKKRDLNSKLVNVEAEYTLLIKIQSSKQDKNSHGQRAIKILGTILLNSYFGDQSPLWLY